jgi:hypothetical protein
MTKRFLLIVACVAVSLPAILQAQETGVSHPELVESTPIEATPAAPIEIAKPSPVVPADPHAPVLLASSVETPVAPRMATNPADGPDAGIVTRVPTRPGELAEGTILWTNLDSEISTEFTQQGTLFSARIMKNVTQDGRVIIPIGSSLRGRVTRVTENRRIKGRAKLRLRPDEIVMPDGTHLILHAQVIDTGKDSNTKTDGEGTIVSRDNAKKNWAITGATTGTGAVTGALLGGGVGAVVGTVVGAGIGAGHFIMAHQVAALPKSSTVVFQLTEPMSIAPLHE